MLIPSIDLMGGKAVQLRHGRDKVLERDDPIELAREFGRHGEVAVIDLDAAMDQGNNEALIREIVKVAACRVGGGIRDEDKARRMLRAGAEKIIIGTAASRDLLSRLPRHRVMAALDSVDGDVVTRGWTQRTGRTPVEMMQILAPYVSGFLSTFVETEGMMGGLPLDRVRELSRATSLPLTVAGGVRSVDEVRALDAQGIDVQVGMALYTGVMRPYEAFIACVKFARGTVPTAVVDENGQVLQVRASSAASLRQTLETGFAAYAAGTPDDDGPGPVVDPRTPQRLARAFIDCGRSALLFRVAAPGAACHRGTHSCFAGGAKDFNLVRLQEIVAERFRDPRPGSYTAFLFEKDDRIPRKLNEELWELLNARTHDNLVWEAADVMFFLLAWLVKNDVGLDEVVKELRGREK